MNSHFYFRAGWGCVECAGVPGAVPGERAAG